MAERVRLDLLWDGPVGAELRALGPVAQLVTVYLWTVTGPYGLSIVRDDQVLGALAIEGRELRKVWEPLAAMRLVLERDGWVWLPLYTQRCVGVAPDPLPYEDKRLVDARKWFCSIAVDNPFRPDIHAQFAAEWGLPALGLIVPSGPPKALVAASVQRDLNGFELTPPLQPLLIPDARVDSRELFEAWWQEYPKHRRTEKIRAWAVWQAIRPVITYAVCDVMIKLLRQQARSADWLEEGGRYVPYPAKYLARGRWLDEVSRVAALPRVDVENAMALESWLANRRGKLING